MKSFFCFLIFAVLCVSCGAKKINSDDLPKDISLKPERTKNTDSTLVAEPEKFDPGSAKKMQDLREQIEELIASETCDDITKWRISPLGAKPCGGPAKYIAYPKSKESEILSKVKEYTELQSAYNKANGLMSDCALVPPPAGIQCENGKVVLVRSAPPEQSVTK